MKVPLNVFVEMDTRNWFETVAATLSRQREKEVTLAEAIDYVSTKLIRGKGLVKS